MNAKIEPVSTREFEILRDALEAHLCSVISPDLGTVNSFTVDADTKKDVEKLVKRGLMKETIPNTYEVTERGQVVAGAICKEKLR